MNQDKLIPAHGGYRQLKSFQHAELVYDATVKFCDRFIDKRSRTHDQMVQAARSGRQNIAEGSQASGTSKKFELKLVGVARASLEELLLDYEDFLRQRGLALWGKNHPTAQAVRRLAYEKNRSYLTNCLASEPCAISLQPSRLRITTRAKAILRSGGNVVQPSGMRPDNSTLQNEITLRAVKALSCVEWKKRMADEKDDERLPAPAISADAYEREETTDLKDETPDRPKGWPLHTRILIGLVAGVVAGIATNYFWGGDNARVTWIVTNITEPVGALFLRLLLMTVIPLVFSSLVIGVAGIGDVRKLGRVGLKAFAYTLVISAISVVIGLTLANTIRPGERIDPATADALQARYGSDATKQVEAAQKPGDGDSVLMTVVKTIVPTNPIAAIAGVKKDPKEGDTPNMIHLMFFALILGVATTMISTSVSAPFVRGLEALYEISAKIIDIIMKFAPFAVACLLFNNTARFGLDLLGALAWFVVTVLAGLAIHMFGVYSLSVYFLSRLSPVDFFRRIKTVMLTAFSTSSSNATLPTALRVSEENLGVPREINSFVLTVGATANQNGTALYEGVTVLFLAQLAGIDLTLGQQVMVAYLAILGGIGTAGVPSGSIPFIVVVLVTIGVNPALIAIILGVDRILDMCRTTLNVTGDITAATYVARSEGYELLKSPGRA